MKYLSEIIQEDCHNWNNGDAVIISTQTGTGKTTAILGKDGIKGLADIFHDKKFVYICNRKNLKQETYFSMMEKYKIDSSANDIYTIKNVTICTYQSLQDDAQNATINHMEIDDYDFIICDECHYFLEDSTFNTGTEISFKYLVEEEHENSIMIFISATIQDVEKLIKNSWERRTGVVRTVPTIPRDYKYIKPYYVQAHNVAGIIADNNNNHDTAKDKWVVFVTSKNVGIELSNLLNEYHVSNALFFAETKGKLQKDITEKHTFDYKVLIATKVLDNGVDLIDDTIKNIVLYTVEETEFVQELGRVRINKNDKTDGKSNKINLFIVLRGKGYVMRRYNNYKSQVDAVEFHDMYPDEFNTTYSRNHKKIPGYVLYPNKNVSASCTDLWLVNKMAYQKAIISYGFYAILKDKYEKNPKDKFICLRQQLSYINKTMDDVSEVFPKSDKLDACTLNTFLDNAYNGGIYDKEVLIDEINQIINGSDYLKKKFKKALNRHATAGLKIYNRFIASLNIDYQIVNKRETINGVKKVRWYVGGIDE